MLLFEPSTATVHNRTASHPISIQKTLTQFLKNHTTTEQATEQATEQVKSTLTHLTLTTEVSNTFIFFECSQISEQNL